ncbi:hypothetical protein R6242_05655 [Iodobacter sp. CM08]|uniref:type IV pilus assembly protein FimV n=1 Tax=Iodobacter sp. CM08 TaxID=3085902 RepID=UPI0029817D39|nr:hypothetical protein [Iodobacter sp. CM08]MDW5416054.1 hypothetical protein [Iodobacter sp. CM08]
MRLNRYLLLASVLLQPAYAAVLGDLQVRSALGERFNARINVVANDGDELDSHCFRLVATQDENVAHLRAHLSFEANETGGQLVLRGDEPLQEPLVNFSIRLRCASEKSAIFQRDYNVLLDPREYKSKRSIEVAVALPTIRRQLPAFAGIWQSQEGDSVERIARAYFPQDRAKKARMVDEIYRLNPDLAQNTNARLPINTNIKLPDRNSVLANVAVSPEVAPAKTSPSLALAPQLARDSLQIAVPPALLASSAGFHLRMSDSILGAARKSQLSPEESLLARERLQILEADDQTAQLLQYKYQITQLEKQLASLQDGHASASDVGVEALSHQEERSWPSPWWLLLLLLPVMWWRFPRRQMNNDLDAFPLGQSTFASIATPVAMSDRLREVVPSRNQVMGMVNNFSQAASDWSRDDMDVVQPKNVSEEAQMLLDHGLITQAINLLISEVEQYPSSLALWMKLFDIYVSQGMRQDFQNRAVGFRLQFSSDSLWQQVQSLGRSIDEDNPLYLSLDEKLNLPLALDKEAAQNRETSAIELSELPRDTAFAFATGPWDNELDQQFTLDTLDIPALKEISFPVELPRINLDDFLSSDPALQTVIGHLELENIQAACNELEQLLYRGTMEQRQLAVKWLDILIPLQM